MTPEEIAALLAKGSAMLSSSKTKAPKKKKAPVEQFETPEEFANRTAWLHLESYHVMYQGNFRSNFENKNPQVKMHLDIYDSIEGERVPSFPPCVDCVLHFHSHGVACLPIHKCRRIPPSEERRWHQRLAEYGSQKSPSDSLQKLDIL
jgi:hypothetical protein